MSTSPRRISSRGCSSPTRRRDELLLVLRRRAQAVDARDGGDDHDIAAGQERRGRGVPQPVDVVVDRRVLLDVRVRGREVRLGLVVVVVRDEVLDRVLGEELAELVAELGRERLVVRDHERRALEPRDHVRDGERLAGAGRPEERREAISSLDAGYELVDRLRLIACGKVVTGKSEFGHTCSLQIGRTGVPLSRSSRRSCHSSTGRAAHARPRRPRARAAAPAHPLARRAPRRTGRPRAARSRAAPR